MDKTETRTDVNPGQGRADAFVRRHLSQLKILTRLVEHELDTSKGQEVTIDRELVESMLDTLEIFVEDLGGESGTPRARGAKAAPEKPAVTRLN
ncbi:MAG: hypothetical protein IPM29_12465 [Planctomycetes bacterium]|nr:hypothetical protein [Planctomycetota bacterium]